MERCIKVGTFGLRRKHFIANVRKGDKVVCCAGKGDWKIIAVGAATSDYYMDTDKVFLQDALFPDRFDFRAEKLARDFDLMSVIDRLSFVTNLAYWAVFFRNGIAKMSEQDWKMISGERVAAS